MADWLVWCPEQGETRDDAEEFIGYSSPEEAAAGWAADRDIRYADYSIVSGQSEPVVLVAPADGSAEPARLRVTGEAVPHYTARRVEGDDASRHCTSADERGLVSGRRITSDCGWLSPDGRWYPCREEEHADCAGRILDSLEPGKWTGPEREHFGGYERELELRGYVKLGAYQGIYAADESRVTPRQKRLLVDWLTSDANEHMTWPWWLEPGDEA